MSYINNLAEADALDARADKLKAIGRHGEALELMLEAEDLRLESAGMRPADKMGHTNAERRTL